MSPISIHPIAFGLSNRQIKRRRKKGQISPMAANKLLGINGTLRRNFRDYRLGLKTLKQGKTEIFAYGYKQTIRMFLTLCMQTIASARSQKKAILEEENKKQLSPGDLIERNPLSTELKESGNRYTLELLKLSALPTKIYTALRKEEEPPALPTMAKTGIKALV